MTCLPFAILNKLCPPDQVLEGDHLEHTLLYKVVETTLEQKAQTGPLDALVYAPRVSMYRRV